VRFGKKYWQSHIIKIQKVRIVVKLIYFIWKETTVQQFKIVLKMQRIKDKINIVHILTTFKLFFNCLKVQLCHMMILLNLWFSQLLDLVR
jgi:hypothetical protein